MPLMCAFVTIPFTIYKLIIYFCPHIYTYSFVWLSSHIFQRICNSLLYSLMIGTLNAFSITYFDSKLTYGMLLWFILLQSYLWMKLDYTSPIVLNSTGFGFEAVLALTNGLVSSVTMKLRVLWLACKFFILFGDITIFSNPKYLA